MMVELGNKMRPYEEEEQFPDTPDKILALHVKNKPPKLTDASKKWSTDYIEFVDHCLQMENTKRKTANSLRVHKFVRGGWKYKTDFMNEMERQVHMA